MESYFDIMAQSPHCLLAVDATDGGKWKSNFNSNWVMPTAPTGTGSFEETHGLLTKNNVEAENDYFKHTTNDNGYIETPLDLRGYAGDFTMISKAYIPSAGTSFTFFVQNNNRYRSSRFHYNGNSSNMGMILNNSSDVRTNYKSADLSMLDRTIPHVFAVTVSKSEKNVTFYVDGVKKSATPLSSDFDYFSNTKGSDFSNIQIMQSNYANDGSFTYDFDGKLFASLFFNKELTEDEIKILSDSLLPKNTASEEPEVGLLCTTPTNLTSNTSNASNADWECYTQSLNANSDGNTANAYLAASGSTTEGTRWKNTYAEGSAGVRFVWKRTDLAEWAVKQVKIGNTITSVMPQQIKSFTLQGSNDGTTWMDVGTLQTQSQPPFNTYTENTFSYTDNTSKYKYWGILCNNVTYPEVAVSSTIAAANLIQFTNEI